VRQIEAIREQPALSIQDDERSLIERIAAGDRTALEQLYNRYERPLFRFVTSLARERGLAEEILQDTFVAVWRGAGAYEGRAAVRIWLFGVARRQAHNAMRRRHLPAAEVDELDTATDLGPTPEEQALANERREDLTAAVGRLATIHRETLALIFVEGLSYREAAEVLGVPEGTVKSRLNHARLALRRLIPPEERDQ
jgi:RNA polymerase sigma-70 factor (ECF subfamily)